MTHASALAIAAAAGLAAACTWASLDAIAPPGPGVDGGIADVGGPPLEAGPGAEASTGPSSDPCTASATPAREWTFDSTVDGWSLETDTGVQATLTWTGATGDPAPGALQADVTPASTDSGGVTGAWVAFIPPAPIDLSNRTVAAWVWLDSGESPNLKVFVQTGAQYNWADNGTLRLEGHQWICVSLPVSTPSYKQPNYDPTRAVGMGFEMLGLTPFRIFIDSVRYY